MQDNLFNDLSEALDALPSAFVLYDADEKIVICNSAYRNQYRPFQHMVKPGISHTELQWLKVKEGLDKNAIGREEEFIAEEQAKHRHGPEMEEYRDDHGNTIRLLRSRMSNGSVAGLRLDVSDLRNARDALETQNEQLKQARKSLFELAKRDELTGLLNRRAVTSKIKTFNDERLAVLQVDLDGFKLINDNEGHAAGDSVLMQTADRLAALLTDDGILARVGGDEFQIVLVGRACEREAIAMGNRVVKTLSHLFDYNGRACQIGASVGIAVSSEADRDFEDLVKRADVALYQSKENGRGRVTVFTEELAIERSRQDMICAEIGNGYFAENFEIMLHPVISASDHTITSMQAVAHWSHPKLGLVQLDEIQRELKRMSRGTSIEMGVLTHVLECINRWGDLGWQVPAITLSVSHNLLGNPRLLDTLKSANLTDKAMALCVSGPLQNSFRDETLDWNLDGIRELGVDLHYEGFGANTTIAELLTLKPGQLILDTEVTQSISEQDRARETVQLAVILAKSIGATTVAKDVEDTKDAALLSDLNCNFLQGAHVATSFQAKLYDTPAVMPDARTPMM